MADRIITVTDPSIVTNDTLVGYNNYSDIDGQLGTTMTPTEATNGKTVTLSDGVVHEVTTKPVGTTNGEFSAVVSNAVEVDLSSSVVLMTDLNTTLRIGNYTWNDTTKSFEITDNGTIIDYDGGALGAFSIQFAVEENVNKEIGFDFFTEYAGTGVKVHQPFLSDSFVCEIERNGGNCDNATPLTPAVGNYLRISRATQASDFLFHYFDGSTETLMHTYDANDVPVYFAFYGPLSNRHGTYVEITT